MAIVNLKSKSETYVVSSRVKYSYKLFDIEVALTIISIGR